MCSIDGQSSSAASSSLPSTTLCTVVAVVFTQCDDTDRSEIGASSFDASTAIKLVAPTRQLLLQNTSGPAVQTAAAEYYLPRQVIGTGDAVANQSTG